MLGGRRPLAARELKDLRRRAGLTQTALGSVIGRTKQQIIRYEKGHTLLDMVTSAGILALVSAHLRERLAGVADISAAIGLPPPP